MAEKSLKKNAFYNVLKSLMNLIFPVITFPYASRILEPEGIGKINFATNIIQYFIMLATLGITSYGVREAARIRDDKTQLTQFAKEMFIINIITTILSYVLFVVLALSIPKFYEYRYLLFLVSVKIIFNLISFDWLFSALEEFKYITLRSIFFQIIGIIFLFIFVKTKEDLYWYATFGIISSVGSNICNFFYTRFYIDWKLKINKSFRKHLKPIFIFFGMTVATSIYTMLDSVMLGFLSTESEIGFYSAATKLNRMVLGLLTALIAVLTPRLSNFMEKGDSDSFSTLTEKGYSVTFLLSIPIVVGLFLLSEPLISLFCGPKYAPAKLTMQTITPTIFVISLASMCLQVISSTRKEKVSLYSYLIGASTNLIANFLFIPHFGALGAAIGTIISESTVTFIQVTYLRKIIFKKQIIKNFFDALFSSIIMGILLFFEVRFFENNFLKIIIGFLSGITVYSISLVLFKNTYFIFYIKKGLSKVIRKTN